MSYTLADRAAEQPKRPKTLPHIAAYALSLVERVLRSIVSTAGHVLRPLLFLIPGPVRKGRFFRLAVERQVRMLVDEVGQARLFPGEPTLSGPLAKRMAVGGVIDNLLTVGLHASPLWILLGAADVSEGAAAFVQELGEEMTRRGYGGEGEALSSVDRVLVGMSRLSGSLAESVDAPPLDFASLRVSLAKVRGEMADVGALALEHVPDIDRLAERVMEGARADDRGLIETIGALSIGTLARLGRMLGGGLAGMHAAADILGRRAWYDVLGDYGDTLDRMRRRGVVGSLARFLRPQGRSWRALFSWHFLTLTERLLSAGRWTKAPWRLAGPVAVAREDEPVV